MGFTRYWTRPEELDADTFREFSKECQKFCKTFKHPLVEASFTDEVVRFEGVPSCETFMVRRFEPDRWKKGNVFEFCKTQHLPYDTAVLKCLELLKKHFPEVELPKAG